MSTEGYHQLVNGQWMRVTDGTGPYVQTAPGVFTLVAPDVGAELGDTTEVAPATDTAPSGLNGRLQRIAQRLTNLIATVAGTTAAVDATTSAVGTTTAAVNATTAAVGATNTLAGAVTETAPANDTASSGLNGRLQRIAQRTTSLITLVTNVSGDWFQRVGFGLISGYERASGWGNNPDVDTGTLPEVISPLGTSAVPWMNTATSLEILSANAADTAAGTGARTVAVFGLDASYNRVTVTVTLNGVTPVALGTQLVAINQVRVMTQGSGGTNAGLLTVRDAGGGTTRILVPAGRSISQCSGYTVPAGYTLQINRHLASINRTETAGRWITYTGAFQLWDGTQYGPVILPLDIAVSDTAIATFHAEPGLVLPERSRFWLQVTALSGSNTDVTAAWWGVLKLNSAS